MIIEENISLKPYNTFGIDVTASYFTKIKTEDALLKLITTDVFTSQPHLMIGGGSNILFTKNYHGLVIKNEIEYITKLKEDDEHIYVAVGSGVNWHQFVITCIANNWGGVENLSLIPGCVGACPIQNIGAYGVEVKNVITQVNYIDLNTKTQISINNKDCKFGYRDSIFKNELKGIFLITEVQFVLQKNSIINTSYGAIQTELDKHRITLPTIKDVSDAVIAIRSSKLPDPSKIGNAGSFFKNPSITNEQFETLTKDYTTIVGYANKDNKTTKVAAGWLIEHAGLKGVQVGNTGCHAMQALVLVNYGQAKGTEIYEYSQTVIDIVKNKFGIELEREVNII